MLLEGKLSTAQSGRQQDFVLDAEKTWKCFVESLALSAVSYYLRKSSLLS